MNKREILYVDDEIENLMVFRFGLHNDFDIYTANSADEALTILNDKDISVVVSDQRMKGKTGIEFFEELSEKNPDIIKILITAYADMDAVIDAINRGKIYYYFNKPYDVSNVKIVLDRAFEIYDMRVSNLNLLNELKLKNNELKDALNIAQNNEANFYNIFNTSYDGILILDLKYSIMEANSNISHYFKLEKEKLIDTDIRTYFSDELAQVLQKHIEKIKTDQVFKSLEIEIASAKSKSNLIEIYFSFIDFNEGKAILAVIHDLNERKENELRILEALIQGEEKERGRIAKDLHDHISPLLSTIKIYLHTLNSAMEEEKRNNITTKISETINESINSIKEISANITPHILKNFGFSHALNSFCQRLDEAGRISISIDMPKELFMQPNAEVNMYRVLTELVNNTLKYAQATKIDIIISLNEYIEIHYHDNGIGLLLDISNSDGMGLFNMKSRVNILQGKINIFNKDGFNAIIKLPLDNLKLK